MKHVFLYFGSFNPIHKGHMALAEHVIGEGLCDGVIFIVSPQNPLKEADGLMPELARFEMVETACLESKYPQAIQASAIEFLLDKPSYTIDTLRYLTQNHGKEMRFSVLMGADIIPQLDKWKDYRELLDKYDIYVYPRKGYAVDRYLDRITYLADAPTFEYSSTEIRERAARGESITDMVCDGVAKYISSHGLLKKAADERELLDGRIANGGGADAYIERGRYFYRRNEWGNALNDFNAALKIDPDNREAGEFVKMIGEILEFRYKDIYNP